MKCVFAFFFHSNHDCFLCIALFQNFMQILYVFCLFYQLVSLHWTWNNLLRIILLNSTNYLWFCKFGRYPSYKICVLFVVEQMVDFFACQLKWIWFNEFDHKNEFTEKKKRRFTLCRGIYFVLYFLSIRLKKTHHLFEFLWNLVKSFHLENVLLETCCQKYHIHSISFIKIFSQFVFKRIIF